MENTGAKVVWVQQSGPELSFEEVAIAGGVHLAVDHARELMRRGKEVLLGQVLSSDGKVLATFTGVEDGAFKFAH